MRANPPAIAVNWRISAQPIRGNRHKPANACPRFLLIGRSPAAPTNDPPERRKHLAMGKKTFRIEEQKSSYYPTSSVKIRSCVVNRITLIGMIHG